MSFYFNAPIQIPKEQGIRLFDDEGNNHVTLQGTTNISSNYTLKMPSAIGTANQYLRLVDTTGNLAFADVSSGDVYLSNILADTQAANLTTSTGDITVYSQQGFLNLDALSTVRVLTTTESTTSSTGGLVINSGVGIAKNLNVGSEFGVSGNANVTKSLTVTENADVTGTTTLGSTLTVTGDVTASSELNVSGNVGVTKNVDVTGTLDATGAATLGSTLSVTGDVTASSELNVSGNVGVTKNVDVTGTLDATGAATLGSTLTVTGDITASSELNVSGNVGVTKNVDVTGTLDATGAATLGSTLSVTGDVTASSELNVSGNVAVTKNVDVTGTLGATGATTLGSTLSVTGDVTASGNMTVTGDLTVNGTTTTINSNITSVDDPVMEIGTAVSGETFDRGLIFHYADNDGAKKGFFGWDRDLGGTANTFVYYSNVDVSSGSNVVASGTLGDAKFENITANTGFTTDTLTVNGDTITATSAAASFDSVQTSNLTMNGHFFMDVDSFDGTGPQGLTPATRVELIDASTNTACIKSFNHNTTNEIYYNCDTVAATNTGQLVHLFYNNQQSGSANVAFTGSNLFAGTGSASFLVFTQTGQSATLVFLDTADAGTSGWRIINTGATVF